MAFVDLTPAAGRHLPAVLTADARARHAPRARGEKPPELSLGDRCVLTTAVHADLPVRTGDRYWTLLPAHGLDLHVHLYQESAPL